MQPFVLHKALCAYKYVVSICTHRYVGVGKKFISIHRVRARRNIPGEAGRPSIERASSERASSERASSELTNRDTRGENPLSDNAGEDTRYLRQASRRATQVACSAVPNFRIAIISFARQRGGIEIMPTSKKLK